MKTRHPSRTSVEIPVRVAGTSYPFCPVAYSPMHQPSLPQPASSQMMPRDQYHICIVQRDSTAPPPCPQRKNLSPPLRRDAEVQLHSSLQYPTLQAPVGQNINKDKEPHLTRGRTPNSILKSQNRFTQRSMNSPSVTIARDIIIIVQKSTNGGRQVPKRGLTPADSLLTVRLIIQANSTPFWQSKTIDPGPAKTGQWYSIPRK